MQFASCISFLLLVVTGLSVMNVNGSVPVFYPCPAIPGAGLWSACRGSGSLGSNPCAGATRFVPAPQQTAEAKGMSVKVAAPEKQEALHGFLSAIRRRKVPASAF